MLGNVVLVCLFALPIGGLLLIGLVELVYRVRRRWWERRERRRQYERDFCERVDRQRNNVASDLDLRERRRLVQRELDRHRR